AGVAGAAEGPLSPRCVHAPHRGPPAPHRLLDLPEHRLYNALPSPVDLLALRARHLGPHLLLGRAGLLGGGCGGWRLDRLALSVSGDVGVPLPLLAPHGIRGRPASSLGP